MHTQMLTLKEVQEKLRIGKTALKTLINEDPDFITIKMGHRRLMRSESLERYLAAKEEQDANRKEQA